MPGSKFAIVPVGEDYLGLFCTEMPESRFEDIVEVTIPAYAYDAQISLDPSYLATCEEESVKIVSVVTSRPVLVGAEINWSDCAIMVTLGTSLAEELRVTMKVSGIRKGFRDNRFPRFSQEEMKANNAFWSSSTKYEQ